MFLLFIFHLDCKSIVCAFYLVNASISLHTAIKWKHTKNTILLFSMYKIHNTHTCWVVNILLWPFIGNLYMYQTCLWWFLFIFLLLLFLLNSFLVNFFGIFFYLIGNSYQIICSRIKWKISNIELDIDDWLLQYLLPQWMTIFDAKHSLGFFHFSVVVSFVECDSFKLNQN